jgi:meso-butanediol dehydrogenase / (S,S)-butanediol dehydrogenase / diacetyl reductase
MDFTGKVALVTGSSGMGLAAALRLARGGARVHLCGIDAQANEAARAAAEGLAVTVHTCNVAEEASVAAWVAAVMQVEVGIDILVNAAGIQTYGNLDTTSIEDWDRVMSVNLRGSFLTSHFVWPHMKGRGAGSIIHISSVQGHTNQYGVLGYATTKGAVHAMTRAMAVDCAKHGVRVNSISPGSIRTPLLEYGATQLAGPGGRMEDMLATFGAAHPAGRVGTVEEVAELVAYLCSDLAAFTTGADFRIDGGLTAYIGV